MKKRTNISVDDLPEFDAAPYLESDEAIAVCKVSFLPS